MHDARRQVWRVSRNAYLAIAAFGLVCLVVLPGLAALSWFTRHSLLVPIMLGVLALIGVVYAWRFGLHPRLQAGPDGVVVRNPLRTHRLDWSDITVLLPGENGLVLAGPEHRLEVWCVQKSPRSERTEATTRSDRVADELWRLWETQNPPITVDEQVQIRRARPGEERVLAELERTASQSALSHIFPGERFPYPIESVTDRWQEVLRDPLMQTHLLDHADAGPIGYGAHSASAVLHLGVGPDHQNEGYGSALLECLEDQIFADPFLPESSLWVLEDNHVARAFYLDRGWRDTDNRRRSPYPPKPTELRMIKSNPHGARRQRVWKP